MTITDRDLLESKILLRPDEVSRILRVSIREVYRMVQRGDLEPAPKRRPVRISSESVRAWLPE